MELRATIEKRLKEREKMVSELQSIVDLFAENISKLTDHDLKTYQMLHKPDCLYSDSPLSSMKLYHHVQQYMIKKDLDYFGFALDGKPALKTLMEVDKEMRPWVLRYTTKPEPEKKGIEAIL